MAEVRDEESERAKELRELKTLFDDGVIDEDEWKEKKSEVLRQPWVPAKREAPPADAPADTPPKKAKPPSPSATPPPAQPASIDLTNDTEAPPPPVPAAAAPVAPPVAPPAAMPPPIAALLTAARAIAQPPRGITANTAALARYLAHDQYVLRKRDDWEAFLSADNVDSGDDDDEPQQLTGSFTDWEDAKYLELLIIYGQPKNENPPAMQKFLEEFGYRARASVTAHVTAFNVGAYKTWRAANGGQWAPFAWVKN